MSTKRKAIPNALGYTICIGDTIEINWNKLVHRSVITKRDRELIIAYYNRFGFDTNFRNWISRFGTEKREIYIKTVGNIKTGKREPYIGFPAGEECGTCRKGCFCNKICYAKTCFVQELRLQFMNLYLVKTDRNRFFSLLKDWIIKHKSKKPNFRFHESGDFIDVDYAIRVHELIRDIPDVHFQYFTKQYEFVNEIYKEYVEPLKNLTIMFSADNYIEEIPNPYNIPVAEYVKSTLIKDTDNVCVYYEISEDGTVITHKERTCAECMEQGIGCASVKRGNKIRFPIHGNNK